MLNIIISILQIGLAIGFVLFWTYFFLVENKKTEHSEIYLAFERSFPLPDLGWITPTLIISAIGNISGQTYGIFFSIVSGGSLIFLGLLDLSFNAQQHQIKRKSDLLSSLAINIICLIFGIIFLVYGWIFY
ncbi:MAG: hypothetical protein GF329_18570 [Candidatus Lokiarchaeota archaeon]|nr:hypothetical protein [Candidatus Lokiarchaeota archaeon]